MAADVSFLTYFAPVFAFLIVSLLMFLLLKTTKPFGDSHPWIDTFISLMIASIFVAAGSVRQVVISVIPWFALLIVALLFILVLAGLVGKKEMVGGKVGWAFVLILVVVFLISGVRVFSHTLAPYLPGPYFGATEDVQTIFFLSWLYSPPVVGAIVLIIAAALVSWVLVKYGK